MKNPSEQGVKSCQMSKGGTKSNSSAPTSSKSSTAPTSKAGGATDYLDNLKSGGQFNALVDDFMSRFGQSFDLALKGLDQKGSSGEATPSSTAKAPDASKAPPSEPAAKPAPASVAVKEVKPQGTLSSSKTTTTKESGRGFDLVTVKNDKMEAGFLLPKKDKAKPNSAQVPAIPAVTKTAPVTASALENGAKPTAAKSAPTIEPPKKAEPAKKSSSSGPITKVSEPTKKASELIKKSNGTVEPTEIVLDDKIVSAINKFASTAAKLSGKDLEDYALHSSYLSDFFRKEPDAKVTSAGFYGGDRYPAYEDEDEDEEDDMSYPPRPRNFLEAALYFSTVTLGTVAMANQLHPIEFFAPPLFTRDANFAPTFESRKATGDDYHALKFLQRRICALFAVALSQGTPMLRPYWDQSGNESAPSGAAAGKTNYLKRSIGFFAVSLVDHLPSGISSRLFQQQQKQKDSHADCPPLGLDDLRVPSPEILGEFWLGLTTEQRLGLVREEAAGLAKGWVNGRKTWCMCKYCKHRRLRLSDIFEHVYRAYHDELLALEARLQGLPESAKTSQQLKVRRLLYRALSVVADDILNTRSRLMLEATNRLGRAFHEDAHRVSRSGRKGGKNGKCECPNCDYEGDEDDDDDDDNDEYEDDDEYYSDYDDLDIEEDGDFYEDFNYGEDDAYLQREATETAVDEAQLPSTLPSFYDMDLMYNTVTRTTTAQGKTDRPASFDACADGQSLFSTLIAQIFQFHLVPAYLEHQALEKQRELIREEEEAGRMQAERELARQAAKREKKERQKAARAAAQAAVSPPDVVPVACSTVSSATAPSVPAEAKDKPVTVEAKKPKAVRKEKPVIAAPPIVQPLPLNTAAFAVEDIAPLPSTSTHDDSKLSKSARRKKKKAIMAAAASTSASVHSEVGYEDEVPPGFLQHEDVPPGLFAPLGDLFGAPASDPPPPYTMFDGIPEDELEPLEPLDAMTRDEVEAVPVPPLYTSWNFDSLFPVPPAPAQRVTERAVEIPGELFDRPPFSRRYTRTAAAHEDAPGAVSPPAPRIPTARAAGSGRASPVLAGLEGFDPFAEWNPVLPGGGAGSSLFSTPLYPRRHHDQQ